jgi:hypothetical protein
MAKFVHFDGFYINPELVIYIQGDSDPSEPVCGIYFKPGETAITIERPASQVAALLSKP